MLGYCGINPDMGCPMVTKSLEIPCQMRYLTQLYEADAVTRNSMNLRIGNLRRLL